MVNLIFWERTDVVQIQNDNEMNEYIQFYENDFLGILGFRQYFFPHHHAIIKLSERYNETLRPF